MVAIVGDAVLQLPPLVVSARVIVWPTHTVAGPVIVESIFVETEVVAIQPEGTV
jgi:uncharacterized phosphosugar-binding protein